MTLCLALLVAFPTNAAELLGSFHWTFPKDYFGGMSGIDVTPDGQRFVAIGDNGQIIEGTIQRDGDRVTAMEFPYVGRLLTTAGERVQDERMTDSEGIALGPDGRIHVSFERTTRVWSYRDWLATAQQTWGDPYFDRFWFNGGPEALAVDQESALYVVPEKRIWPWERRWIYRFNGERWERWHRYPGRGRYKPVGADIGPDGRFYFLERRFIPLLGFKSRVRRFEIGRAGLVVEETIVDTGFGTHDNLEGLAVWAEPGGAIRLTMLSDDNYSRFQRTEIVEYRLPP